MKCQYRTRFGVICCPCFSRPLLPVCPHLSLAPRPLPGRHLHSRTSPTPSTAPARPAPPTLQAKACGLPPDTPLVQTISDDPATAAPKPAGPLEASRAGLGPEDLPPFPIPKNRGDFLRFTTMPQDHINYAMTWAVLCVVLAVMARQAILSPPKSIRMVGEANQGLRAWQANSLGK